MLPWQYTKRAGYITSLCLLLAGPFALAAPPPDAGNILKSTQENELKAPAPATPGLLINPQAGQPQATPGGQSITVTGFHILGQNVIPDSELQPLLADSVGTERTFAQLEQLAGRISKHFRDQGYIVARAFIPAQQISDGIVTINVIVGQYGRLDIRNQSTLSTPYLETVTSSLKSGDPIRQAPLERVLLLLGDSSGVTLKSTLTPGKEPGTADLILELSDAARVTGQLYSDNWGNRFTGDVRGGLSVTVNNPSTTGDSFSLGGLYAGSGLHNYNAAYSLPTGPSGAKLGISYSRVSYLLGEAYASLNASGIAKTTSLYESYPVLRSRDLNLNWRIGYDHKDLQDQINLSGTDVKKTADTWNLSFNGDSRDSSGGGATSFDLTLSHGRLHLDSADARSADADANTAGSYTKATLNLLRQKYLTERLSYSLSFNSQLASKNLDSSEKLFLGGASGVRAYPQGEASGDQGYLFTGELRWNMPTPQIQVAAFLDNGRVTLNKSPWDSSDNSRTLTGAGLGIIFSRPSDYSLRLDYAWKITSKAANSDTDKNGRFWVRGIKYF